MMPWRLALSLEVVRREVNALYPGRDKASDGTIGDAAHAASHSDHNPNGAGVVRAWDADAGPGQYPQPPNDALAVQLAEHVRQLGRAGFPALMNGGYVIWSRRIASEVQGWTWRDYHGASPHTDHVHISVSRDAFGYDDQSPWNVAGRPGVKTPPIPVPIKAPPLNIPGNNLKSTVPSSEVPPVFVVNLSAGGTVLGRGVRPLQTLLALSGHYRGAIDGQAGPQTRAALVAFQGRAFGHADAIAGPQTFGALDSL